MGAEMSSFDFISYPYEAENTESCSEDDGSCSEDNKSCSAVFKPFPEDANSCSEDAKSCSEDDKGKALLEENVLPESEYDKMVLMFTAALNAKNHCVEDLQNEIEVAQKDLAHATQKEYDEEFLLHELQRILTANAQLLQNREHLERENKQLRHEGELVSQQLENVSFYMKNTVMDLNQERHQRMACENQIKDQSEALRALYKEIRIVKALAAERQALKTNSSGSKVSLALAKASKRDVKLPGNMAEELEAEFQASLKKSRSRDSSSDSDLDDDLFFTPRLRAVDI